MSPKLKASKGGRVEEDRDERTRVEASGGACAGSRERRRRAHRRRRERKAHFGEMVQLDGSFHDWLEGRGPRACLMNLVDDATGATLCRMGEEETIWAAAGVLQAWIERYGVPQVLYTDWKNIYVPGPREEVRIQGEVAETQFGRMCRRMGIRIIAGHCQQAKGYAS